METGFQKSILAHLDFQAEAHAAPQIPLPDELPRRADLSNIPKDILKSSTVENLISQNEDLMARLKVALRRLSLMEIENQKMTEETGKARLAQSSITDQILIWKEKDGLWRQKIDQLEKEKAIHTEKMRALSSKVESMEADLDRHTRYHEKIKTQVKPYIAQLKEFSRTQAIKGEELQSNLEHKEALLRDLRHQIVELTKNSRFQAESQDKKFHDMVHFYETQLNNLNEEVTEMRQRETDLEGKALRLHAALERQDTLENELVAVRRSKEELREHMSGEITSLQERMSELTKHNQKLGMEHADLQVRVVENSETVKTLEKENRQYVEQLEGLRYMWTAKNEETEKLKVALQSLERLNLELSQKINEMRTQTP
jgi:Chromosome segregation ATPases